MSNDSPYGTRRRPARQWPGLLLALVLLSVVVTGLVLIATSCEAGPTETRDDSFTVGNATVVVVNNENGRIEVNSGPDGEVRVEAILRGTDRIDYEVTREDDTITVEVDMEFTWWFWDNVGADIVVTAPAAAELDLETSNGAVDVYGMEGTAYINTSNGEISLDDVKGDFDATTSNGRIEVDGLEGYASLRTSNGRVTVQDVLGEVDVETSNGRISLSGDLTAGGSSRLETSNGAVDVELPQTASVRLDARTKNGDVTSEIPVTATTTGDNRLVGTIGGGEADLYIRTSNGDITISEAPAVGGNRSGTNDR